MTATTDARAGASPGLATARDRAKAERRAALLRAAAQLFAERGFPRVSLDELGAAAGVSGPAVYKHFASKQAVLAAILVGASEGLLEGGRAVVAGATSDAAALAGLVAFHVDFALANADIIRVQDHDLDSLAGDDRHTVRTLQREYVELWVDVLARLRPADARVALRTRAHACFGLINSTPHSSRGGARAARSILESMALAALAA
ncbi:TetR/AcrR family transcriptional regulator [Microcella alkalica]|uniref:AcrR family transcriptional regulator n=1 Tax=Microcella alkalica TaxID=355930 RepID=A0A839E1Y4_9MICO|nr:TetR/AcrR family transcriptional regulator [Microcella alkalica]MBA8846689.1 AcrR family transcriptional regulator [Microcella alkalica]